MEQKKVIYSGIQPSGNLTLGNYLGAIKNWVNLQEEYNCYYGVVDMHAITVRQEASELRSRCLDVYALLLACGLDPEKNTIYFQSHVSAHAELAWVLSCYTYIGELNRMTQFKEKSTRHADNINAGLYTYPILMAADILLYQGDLVPVGADQKQHLELSRDIAIRFNNLYGEVFKIPEPYIPKVGARIMSLSEPDKKMSKSEEDANSYVLILDEPATIMKKFKRAVTDSENRVALSEDKPGVSNLINIMASATQTPAEKICNEYENKGYGVFKEAVAQAVIAQLEPLQSEYKKIRADKAYLDKYIKAGREKAESVARKTLSKVYRKVGLASYDILRK